MAMTHNINFDPQVPRLAVGAGPEDGSRMCAEQVISWENGEKKITDRPACTDPVLRRIIQHLNDFICTERKGTLLCPECSVTVLDIAHRASGTAYLPLTSQQRNIIYVKIALDQAKSVLHLVTPSLRKRAAAHVKAVERWIAAPQYGVSFYPNYVTIDRATNVARSTLMTVQSASYHKSPKIYVCQAVSEAGAATSDLLGQVHRAMDLFEALTQHMQPISPATFSCTNTATELVS